LKNKIKIIRKQLKREKAFDYHDFDNQNDKILCERILFDERSLMIMIFNLFN